MNMKTLFLAKAKQSDIFLSQNYFIILVCIIFFKIFLMILFFFRLPE